MTDLRKQAEEKAREILLNNTEDCIMGTIERDIANALLEQMEKVKKLDETIDMLEDALRELIFDIDS